MGTPLLFLHGNTASSMMFFEIVEKYKDNFKVILIDFLGHGKSDRLNEFPADLWFYEAPQLVSKVIADSFEGERPLKEFTANVKADREFSKHDDNVRLFYQYMQGDDWESVVDNDTSAIIRHEKEIGKFFHSELHNFQPDILLTGSKQDEFVSSISPTYFERTYGEILDKIGHGKMDIFGTGGHPAHAISDETKEAVLMIYSRPKLSGTNFLHFKDIQPADFEIHISYSALSSIPSFIVLIV